jgi:glucose/arabinose dehydrogenase
VDAATGTRRVFASGLRNPVGMAWEPETGALWTSVNERDELGSDLVPDYMTSVRDGAFYGWPYSYYGSTSTRGRSRRARSRRQGGRARLRARPAHGVARARVVARLGGVAPARLRHGMFVGPARLVESSAEERLQGDLRSVHGGKPSGAPVDVLTGFVRSGGDAMGRPVGVAIDGAAHCSSRTTWGMRCGS